MKTKGKREEAESPWLGTMCGMLKGGALAFLTAVAILFLCALAVSNRWLGQGMMDSAVMAACALGALAGGLLAVRRVRGRSLLMGFGAGLILFLLLLKLMQKLSLCRLRGIAGNTLQHRNLRALLLLHFLLQLLRLFQLCIELLFFSVKIIVLSVKSFLSLLQALFLPCHLDTALLYLALLFGPLFM